MTTNKKKKSAARKLVPAAGMLAVSAAMLASSTYAWFTMSREVEVTNISMVATTPEDIQISLGMIGKDSNTPETSGKGVSLAANTGYLLGNASDGGATAPANDWDWSDTADFSRYYQVGKLIPASSDSGLNIFFTPDANGVGKTVKNDAKYYRADDAVNGAGANMEGMDSYGQSGTGDAKATLHAVTDDNDNWASTNGTIGDTGYTSGTDGYEKSTAWNNTKDDGYYVDIPVWFRTSSTEETKLTVKGYVAPRNPAQTLNQDDEALYRAVRVAILKPSVQDCSGAAPDNDTTSLLPLADGMSNISSSGAGILADDPFAESRRTILNWYSGTNNNGAVTQLSGTTGAEYNSNPTKYTYNNGFVTLTSGTGGEYGAATKVIVRVWLEGNDPDCWNDTAGQDWYINLKFGTAGDMDDANITGARKNDGNNTTNGADTERY